jgi:hypothetical protein
MNNTGDSGYALRKYMMTPIIDAAEGSPEHHYTNMHVRTRNIVERTIGLFKSRFRCVSGQRGVLHYTPEVAASIVNACAVRHNICNKANLPVLDDEVPSSPSGRATSPAPAPPPGEDARNNPALRLGQATRQRLVQRLWEARQA